MRREEYEQDATALMGAVDCGTGGRLQHVCGHGEDDAVSPPALLGVRAFRITQRGWQGIVVLGKQQPCFVGAGELLREALALQCGDPLLCSRCCVSVLACRAPRAWASCLQPAARVVLSPRHLDGRRGASSLLSQAGSGA